MTVTFETLSLRISRKLDDPAQSTYDEELIYDAVVSAHMAILPWVPKQAYAVVTSGSAAQTNFALPADVYTVMAVQDLYSYQFLPRASFPARSVRNPTGPANDWIDYPSGYVSLAVGQDIGAQFGIYYLATWDIPDSESDLMFVLEAPDYAVHGIICYCAAYCLKAKGSNTSNIRQWMQRTIDAGNPEDNPLRKHADSLYQDFLNEMKLMPPIPKVGQ